MSLTSCARRYCGYSIEATSTATLPLSTLYCDAIHLTDDVLFDGKCTSSVKTIILPTPISYELPASYSTDIAGAYQAGSLAFYESVFSTTPTCEYDELTISTTTLPELSTTVTAFPSVVHGDSTSGSGGGVNHALNTDNSTSHRNRLLAALLTSIIGALMLALLGSVWYTRRWRARRRQHLTTHPHPPSQLAIPYKRYKSKLPSIPEVRIHAPHKPLHPSGLSSTLFTNEELPRYGRNLQELPGHDIAVEVATTPPSRASSKNRRLLDWLGQLEARFKRGVESSTSRSTRGTSGKDGRSSEDEWEGGESIVIRCYGDSLGKRMQEGEKGSW
ncbi:uncharacterized protein KY384_006667 [Bacidia gigantensis]|uniref:uncharacterized protein n=1 Tax=Bacidia gigantensis TaxID=2732470 RepID=UPI001D05880E|nr:uncharacterized protein KY384_006667 [Bacidia gigantensis]KAG8528978.1 hypothetical protein KY384_006667 [Bacidia gigantensis]